MKTVLVMKLESGDYIAIPRTTSDTAIFYVEEVLGAAIIKSYSLDMDIRSILEDPAKKEAAAE